MCTHPDFVIVQHCPHLWERNQDGEVVRCRDCGELFHRFRPPLLPLPAPRFEWLRRAGPSEDEIAEHVRAERERCLVWQRERAEVRV